MEIKINMIIIEIMHNIFYRAYVFFGIYEDKLASCCVIMLVLYVVFVLWLMIQNAKQPKTI